MPRCAHANDHMRACTLANTQHQHTQARACHACTQLQHGNHANDHRSDKAKVRSVKVHMHACSRCHNHHRSPCHHAPAEEMQRSCKDPRNQSHADPAPCIHEHLHCAPCYYSCGKTHGALPCNARLPQACSHTQCGAATPNQAEGSVSSPFLPCHISQTAERASPPTHSTTGVYE